MEERQDPHTGEWFIPKRRNQIYAGRKNQIGFNNEKARKKRQFVGSINKHLYKNRQILNDVLIDEDEIVISEDFLKGAGFNFNYLTYRKKYEGKIYTMYYDIGILFLQENKILIKKII